MNNKYIYINPHRVEYSSESTARRLHCVAYWQFLTLRIREWRFSTMIFSMKDARYDGTGRSWGSEEEDIIAKSIDAYEKMSGEEKRKFLDLHRENLTPDRSHPQLYIEGWAEIVKDKIVVISPEGRKQGHQEAPNQTFSRVWVSIKEADEDAPGALLHVIDDESPCYIGSREFRDYLHLEIHVRRGLLSRLRREARLQPGPTDVVLRVDGHLMQDEVERALNPSWAGAEYLMLHQGSVTATLRLMDLVPAEAGVVVGTDEPVQAEHGAKNSTEGHLEASPSSQLMQHQSLAAVAKAARGLLWPMWIIALTLCAIVGIIVTG